MVELDCVITNGYVDRETIRMMLDKGWTFVTTVPAKLIHPHALDTDMASIFSKYTPVQVEHGGNGCSNGGGAQ